jgi:hypothetical protein
VDLESRKGFAPIGHFNNLNIPQMPQVKKAELSKIGSTPEIRDDPDQEMIQIGSKYFINSRDGGKDHNTGPETRISAIPA